MKDWTKMTRQDFDTDAGPGALFDLEPAQVAAVEPCGTADLFELIEETE